jgi:hypothetical protein
MTDVIAKKLASDVERLEKFGVGPWIDEPDRRLWKHEGVDCLMKRNMSFGSWCGYVGVKPGHPWYEKELTLGSYCYTCDGDGKDEAGETCAKCKGIPAPESPDVHGGCTYNSLCDGDEEDGICHVPDPGDTDHVFWVGFDCGHSMDLAPGMDMGGLSMGGTYKDVPYVIEQCEQLAEQAKRLAG